MTVTPALLQSGSSTITVIVSDGTLTAQSSFLLTVAPGVPASITTHPQGSSIAPGQSVVLSVAAAGTAPFSYQWYLGASGNTASPIGGATTSSYTTPPLSSNTSYWVRVSNGFGAPADSATATLTVGRILTILADLTFGSVPSTTTRSLTMLLGNAGGAPLTVTGITYPANFSGDWAGGVIAAGATQARDRHLRADGGHEYSGVVTIIADQTSGQTTTPATGTGTGPGAVITRHPHKVAAHPDGPARFRAAAVGIPTPTAQWQRSTNGGATWTDIPDATDLTYTIAATTAAGSGHQFRAVFTNDVRHGDDGGGDAHGRAPCARRSRRRRPQRPRRRGSPPPGPGRGSCRRRATWTTGSAPSSGATAVSATSRCSATSTATARRT